MWYHQGGGYGNDLVEHLLTPWAWLPNMMEVYAEFIRPIVPAQG